MAEDIRDTAIANDMTIEAEKKKALDAVCKQLLSNKVILAYILQYCVDEFKEYTRNEIVECIDEPEISSEPVHRDEVGSKMLETMMIPMGY